MDCRNNPCDFALDLSGQRTSGRCRCWDSMSSGVPPAVRVAVRKTVSEARATLAARDAEIAKLKRQLVWAVRHSAEVFNEEGGNLPILDWRPDGEYDPAGFVFDGTDDGLLAAIDEATEEK